MPLCLGTSALVRATRMPQSLYWAPDVQTFCPFTTNTSPSRRARVLRPARSDPASGSENSWHHTSSPRSMAGRKRCFCASLPWAMSVGPHIPIPTENTPADTSYFAASWLKMAWCQALSPRPPYSTGQVMAPHPPS